VPELASAEVRGELAACLSPLLGRLSAIQREALTLTELGADPGGRGGPARRPRVYDEVSRPARPHPAQGAPHRLP
jgi:hypothetical protein